METAQQIRNIAIELHELKQDVNKIVTTNFVDFLPQVFDNVTIVNNSEKIRKKINELIKDLDDNILDNASLEYKKYTSELKELSKMYDTLMKLNKIDMYFQQINLTSSFRTAKEYIKVIGILEKIAEILYCTTDKILPKLECYKSLSEKYRFLYENTIFKLNKKFEELIEFNRKPLKHITTSIIKISKNSEQLNDITLVLLKTNFNTRTMSQFLQNFVFIPIITKPIALEKTEDDEVMKLQISYTNDKLITPDYKDVFANIKIILDAMEPLNIKLSENNYVFSIIASQIKETLCKTLRDECLVKSIPNNMEEMQKTTLLKDLLEFIDMLDGKHFIKHENDIGRDILVEFRDKIEYHFHNKFCSNIENIAIEIMKKDLHDMVLVGDSEQSCAFRGPSNAIFPSCMISKSVMELKGLLDKTIQESKGRTQDYHSKKLLSTIFAILESYMTKTPSFHEKMLLKIPQQTALFYNNCLYLAFWATKNAECDVMIDLSKRLQNKGRDYFVSQIDNQQQQITDILKRFDLSEQNLGSEPQKLIRQCMRQFDLLKNVWQIVLPEHVYRKWISKLLESFCSEIIKRILVLADITTTMGMELNKLLDIIVQKAPAFYKDPSDIIIEVGCWTKLLQIQMILSASLIQILEAWASGKGTLSLSITAEELRNLIRALFQNTDRRAKILSQIQ